MYWYILEHTSIYHVCHFIVEYVTVHTNLYSTLTCFFKTGFSGSDQTGFRGLVNSTPTIPHKFSKHKGSGFPIGSSDTAAADGRRGSNVYEVNTWLWMFGRGKPRLSGLSEEETAMKKGAVRVEKAKRSAETRRRRKAAKKWARDVKTIEHVFCVCPASSSTWMLLPTNGKRLMETWR